MLCCCTCFCTSSNLSTLDPASASMSCGASMFTSTSSSFDVKELPRASRASSSFRRSCCKMTSHLALTRLCCSSHRSTRPMASSPSFCADRRDHVSCSMNSSKTLRNKSGWCSLTSSSRSALARTIALTVLSYGLEHKIPRLYPSATPGLMMEPGGMRHPAPGWSARKFWSLIFSLYLLDSMSPSSDNKSISFAATATRPSVIMYIDSTNSLAMPRGMSRVKRFGNMRRHINSTNISFGITVPVHKTRRHTNFPYDD